MINQILKRSHMPISIGTTGFMALILLLILSRMSLAQGQSNQSVFEIYGHTMLDAGYNFNQVHPDWTDVMRPTRLPAYDNEFGKDGSTYWSVRQTRFGIKGSVPTDLGDLKTIFEWELFGVGDDAGQTTFRLRHAYGELGQFGAGQYWSPFMDIDVFPNSVEYWGPSGMVFFRNIQVRWMPIQGDTRATIALERPGASGDMGVFEDRVEIQDIQARFPLPDLSAEYRLGQSWGYVELAGMLRYINWEDLGEEQYDYSGDAVGWGLNLSTNLKLGKQTVFRGQAVYGEGIQNYMNDATADIGPRRTLADTLDPGTDKVGKAIPVLGLVAFIDHNWTGKLSTALGYSIVDIDNSDGQKDDAFRRGHYGLVNLLYSPVKDFMFGGEVQFIGRENKDGYTSSAAKIQFSFKYNFSHTLIGK
jgi:hypothetical protein